jgi:hypothetical protein
MEANVMLKITNFPAFLNGNESLDIPIGNIKFRAWREANAALRLY